MSTQSSETKQGRVYESPVAWLLGRQMETSRGRKPQPGRERPPGSANANMPSNDLGVVENQAATNIVSLQHLASASVVL